MQPVVQFTHGPVLLTGADSGQNLHQPFQAVGILPVLVKACLLGIIELAKLPFAVFVFRDGEVLFLISLSGEEHKGPQLLIVNIDHAGRRPHPVIFGKRVSGFRRKPFPESAVHDIHLPLYSGEIDPVVLT